MGRGTKRVPYCVYYHGISMTKGVPWPGPMLGMQFHQLLSIFTFIFDLASYLVIYMYAVKAEVY